jgi:hypothetical protein
MILYPLTAVPADLTGSASITGRTVDEQSGLPLSGVLVRASGGDASARSNADGTFELAGLPRATIVLRAERTGYQPTISDPVNLRGGNPTVILTLRAARSDSVHEIVGRTGTTAAALQTSSTISQSLSTEALAQTGTNRAGDALRLLPGVNNGITGDTSSLGDDINLSIRGIGTLETTALLDGHPIALGVTGGYNMQLSPLAPYRNISLTYGSGSNLGGESAIGGAVDFQTLEPTPKLNVLLSQGAGTFDKSASTVQVTGTSGDGRLGYAFAYGVAGSDGGIVNSTAYQPGAAYDAAATDPAVRALAVYRADSAATSRSALVKARYALSPNSQVTFTSVSSSYYSDKTGNGDGDYLEYAPALAFGNQLLSSYSPAKYPTLPACPVGSFVGTNATGHPNGTGPNGAPDGGSACETPAQYAASNAGFQGVGPAFQTFDFNDEHLRLQAGSTTRQFTFDAFSDRYLNTINRAEQLPFTSVPGDTGRIRDYNVVETGSTALEYIISRNNDLGIGYSYLNVAYNLASVTARSTVIGAPIVRESGIVLHDIYHPANSKLKAFIDAEAMQATATHTSYIDPRASVVYALSPRNVVRLSAGASTTQPAGNELGQPFTPASLGGAGGGATITCGGLNSIGNVPSSALLPERGVDQELSVGHSFGGDSRVELGAYNVNVYNKLYSSLIPLSQTGASFIDPTYLSDVTATIAAKCGTPAAPGLIGVTGTFNVGQQRARGLTLSGRQRLGRATFIDYDWTVDSSALLSAPVTLLQSNQTLILGSQIPHVPLHTLDAAIDQRFGKFEARYTFNAVSANNAKDLPAYDDSDLALALSAGRGTITASISNLFNQYADVRGLQYEGVPLALNSYATSASYAPYIGAAATEQFGLPARALYVNYMLHI